MIGLGHLVYTHILRR